MRTFFAAVLSCVLGLAVVGSALGKYGARHFLPQQKMAAADAAGDGCVLVLGDSRMDAAFDAEAFHQGLRAVGSDRCVVGLAIGATDVTGHFVTVREYLSRGHRPSVAVIGAVGDSLLDPEAALLPQDMVGNQAIHLLWTEPGDVFDEVPGFPGANVATFDAGFRFLAARATSYGEYQSMASIKTQQVAQALTGRADGSLNRFGALGDMARLENRLRSRAPARLAEAMRAPDERRFGAWFRRTADLLEQRGTPLVVVELPMPTLYQKAVGELPQAKAYQSWLAGALARRGGTWLDASRDPRVEDGLFVDTLHVGLAGAALVSTKVGRGVGAFLASPPTP